MIRIVRAARLRALVEDATRARRRVAMARVVVRELTRQARASRADFAALREELAETTADLEAARARILELSFHPDEFGAPPRDGAGAA
ncbi:hypothetical protein [Streptomyces sp. NPDC059816]|uniref:hypothetical protein n=1 Tax=Streptomyces sp. NPDC059816 TaxID=3346960 RepID=UPI0036690E7C